MTSQFWKPGTFLLALLVFALLLAVACGSSETVDEEDDGDAPAATEAPAASATTDEDEDGDTSTGAANTPTPEPEPASTVIAMATAAPDPTATLAPQVAASGPETAQARSIPEAKYGGAVDMHVAGNVAHWNIMECGSGGTCMSPTSPFSNGIVHYNGETPEQLDIRGDLATGWTVSEAGTRYVFALPENARWHDGEPLDSADVVFSINEMLRSDAPRPRSGQIRPYVKEVIALGDYEVQVDLNFASSAFLAFLATDFMKIWPMHHVGTDPDTQKNMRLEENILGSGPFKMVEHQKDVAYRWEKNEDYFKDGLPYLDGMNYYIINDSQSILGAYKAEQVLMTVYLNSNLNVREGQELQDDREGKGRVFFAGPTLWHGMLINTEAEPFNDVRVRRALNLILHRQAFNEIFGAGEYLIGSPLPPDQWFGRTSEEWEAWPGLRQTDGGDKHPDDIAEAQRLMADAGYADGFETSILAANFLSFPDMAQVAANQMERWLGIKATVQPEEPAAGYVRYEAGDWKLGFHGNGILVMDPDQLVAGSYLGKATRNYSGWEPEKVRELYESQLIETDTEKRRELVLELGDYMANEDTHVVITTWAMLVPYVDNRIKNYNVASGFANHTNKEHLWYEE
jgi:peptide/nickel transport system substrate-binding protein